MALPHGMIGFSMTIGGLGVVATGGRGRRIGINPMSVAAPAGKAPPFILDIATSVVAGGKLELARMKGQQIPIGWIVDKQGQPTTNPLDYWDGGAILPLGGGPETGGYKGYGLSVMIDILAGVLSGGGFAGEMRETRPVRRHPALPGRALDRGLRLGRELQGDHGADDRLPEGDRAVPRARRACWSTASASTPPSRSRKQNGIPYHRDVVERITKLSSEIGVPLPEPTAVE